MNAIIHGQREDPVPVPVKVKSHWLSFSLKFWLLSATETKTEYLSIVSGLSVSVGVGHLIKVEFCIDPLVIPY